jgi:hypothetical protein
MSKQDSSALDAEIIDITPSSDNYAPNRFRWLGLAALLLVAITLFRGIGIYVESLWFDSLGFAGRFWYEIGLGWALFAAFGILTVAILRGGFYLLERLFGLDRLAPRKIIVGNNQTIDVNPARVLRPASWVLALLIGFASAVAFGSDWQDWALYWNQPATAIADPIFGNSLGFYLFSLPIYQALASWLTTLAVVLLVATVVYAVLSIPQQLIPGDRSRRFEGYGKTAYSAVSIALGFLLLVVAARFALSRYAYLWTDHSSFSGVTYTEHNYLLPGLMFVAIALAIAAVLLFVNGFVWRNLRMFFVALGLPVAVYVVAVILIPSYVQNFVVKPNELGRETPYIEHNIAGTRAGFNIEGVESREYAAETSISAFNLNANQNAFSNIRLWDWRALQDTLRQVQEIRNYYDFTDVDVDRYQINGEKRQMMIATRELDANKLPEQSKNWINERLVYTHGYGVTMNSVNEFTAEGKPRFVISNMPLETNADIRVTRPEIYFGERTDTDVYVKTKQREFDFPQGENNNYTNYEGDGGFAMGGFLRRLSIAWTLGDLSKLPFSDDVTAESRVLMHRNIAKRIRKIAPFLTFDSDPYIVINDDGRLIWMIDAYTSSARFPYSRHYDVNGQRVNYLRNSVKATVDAYTGAVNFYVFDSADPLVAAYRQTFPELFKDSSEMPAGLRAHVRYPEALIKAQSEVYGLYHTQSAAMFFGREDVWSVAQQASVNDSNNRNQRPQTQSLDPYQILISLPGEQTSPEFLQVVPFTPGNRNNMIAWMAGRSDADVYGKLVVYRFPASRVIDGPAQIEARIDQDAQLSGQITLWNQQGSKVKRGNLIILPIGTGLLFVEPIYLQAERSPMPELRLVVLATQEKLVYAANFETALTQLLGTESRPSQPNTAQPNQPENDTGDAPSNSDLIKRAAQNLADYQRLTAEGKFAEAGQKFAELKQTLEELQRRP